MLPINAIHNSHVNMQFVDLFATRFEDFEVKPALVHHFLFKRNTPYFGHQIN